MRYPKPWFPLSDDPKQCIHRTIRGCRPYRSSLLGYRFGRSGSSESVVYFCRLRWSSCGPASRGRSCRNRCRYRYICRPKRIRFPLRGRLKGRTRVHAYRTYPTSGLEISYRLRLSTICLHKSTRPILGIFRLQ